MTARMQSPSGYAGGSFNFDVSKYRDSPRIACRTRVLLSLRNGDSNQRSSIVDTPLKSVLGTTLSCFSNRIKARFTWT